MVCERVQYLNSRIPHYNFEDTDDFGEMLISSPRTPEHALWSAQILEAWRGWTRDQDVDDWFWLYGPDDPTETGTLSWICRMCEINRKSLVRTLEEYGERIAGNFQSWGRDLRW